MHISLLGFNSPPMSPTHTPLASPMVESSNPLNKGHARASTDNRPTSLSRRVTRGPLDLDFDNDEPASPAVSTGVPPRTTSLEGSALTSPTSTITSRVMSPVNERNLIVDNLKDYSYLTEPQIFRPIPLLDLPEPFRNRPQLPADTPIPSLLLSAHLRAAAISAANKLTSSSPYDRDNIFKLWFIRLACLSLISPSTTVLAAQEIKVFGDLTSAFYRDPETDLNVVPWELRVLAIRLQALGFSDWRRCLEHFYVLAKEARSEVAKAKTNKIQRNLWKARLWDLGVRVASALIEMGDLDGAARHLEGLTAGGTGRIMDAADAQDPKTDNDKVRSMLALLYIYIGNIKAARACYHDTSISDDEGKKLVEAFCLMGDNDFTGAANMWKQLHDEGIGNKEMVLQNMAVCSLYTGRLPEARQTLESIVTDNKQAFHSLVFNLCTLYELCSDDAKSLKLGLAEKVAEMGKEMTNSSFKL